MRVVSVSGASSRAGKTALAVSLLEGLPAGTASAVKFTTTSDVFERCPRGTTCIVCDIAVPYRIVTDLSVLSEPGTDTERLLATGARGVVWAIARSAAAGEAWRSVASLVGDAPLVLEGSSVVAHARPEVSLFVIHPFLSPRRWKQTSGPLIRSADLVVVNRPRAEPRPPAAEVLEAVERLGGGSRLCVADVTEPVRRWAPQLAARVSDLAASAARATA